MQRARLAQEVQRALELNSASLTFPISRYDFHHLRERVEGLLPTASPQTIRQVVADVSASLSHDIHRIMRTIQDTSITEFVHHRDVRYDLLEFLRSDLRNVLSTPEMREAMEVCFAFLMTWQSESDADAIEVNSSVADVYLSVFENRLSDSDRVRRCMLLATADRVVWDMALTTAFSTGSHASTVDGVILTRS
jgi:hypothetical protein